MRTITLRDVQVTAERILDDKSVEMSIEAIGPRGMLSAKLYFADNDMAERFKANKE